MQVSMRKWVLALAASAVVGTLTTGCESLHNEAPPAAPAKVEAKPMPAPAAPMPAPAAPMAKPMVTGMGTAMISNPSGMKFVTLEKTYPLQVSVGSNYDYTFTLKNLSDQNYDDVVVTDVLGTTFKYASATPTPASTDGNVIVWKWARLAPGETVTIKLTGQATDETTIKECFTLAGIPRACVETAVVSPKLQLVKTMTPAAQVCDPIVATLTVTNPGSGVAKNVKIVDTLPAGLALTDGRTSFEQVVGDLGPKESKSFQANIKAAKSGTYTNSAVAMADGGLKTPDATAQVVVTQPVLEITKNCPDGRLLLGRPASYTITVKNVGDGVAKGAMLSDPLPAGTTFVSASDGGVLTGAAVGWNLGDMAPGASKTVSLTLGLTGSAKVTNVANAMAACAAPVSSKCDVTPVGVPDIGTSVSDDNGVVLIGNEHVFHYVVKNQGQIDLTNVKVVATLEDGLMFKSATFPQTAAGQVLTFNVGTLPVGASKAFDIVGVGQKEGELVIQTITTSDQTKSVRNDEQVYYIPAK
jgi:uncharacterized repeat protein (TIGR01451 family)